MAYEFLNALDLRPDELATLRSLGAGDPARLLSVIRHARARDLLTERFGAERFRQIESALDRLVPQERKAEPLPEWKPFTGALSPQQPGEQPAGFSVAPERERLMREIQQLRDGAQTPENRQRAAELEQQLLALLKFA
jgi:hypothetical protein